jgi:indoleamine 2,3-dioxygenase
MSGRLRPTLEALPVHPAAQLSGPAEHERAMMALCALASAYVWGGAEAATVIPAGVAVPLCEVAAALDRPPIVAHASLVLSNWRRIDPTQPADLTNLDTLVTFLGGVDEKWFYLATVGTELAGAPALATMVDLQEAVAADDAGRVGAGLDALAATIDATTAALLAMERWCDPHAFFHRLRPYIAGWPEPGVVYEGVSPEPRTYAGGSAAQSSLVTALDVGLGVRHEGEHTAAFFAEMRRYMPVPHRRFLADLAAGPSVRDYVSGANAAAYDRCRTALGNLRGQHLGIAGRYISRFVREGEAAYGTGGSDFVPLLRQARTETLERPVS